jgi:hypothetical protein
MAFYMMYRHPGGKPGFPTFLDRKLDRDSAGTCERGGAAGEFLTSFSAPMLTFRCKHKTLSFDYDSASGGEFFLSERLWSLAEGLNLPEHKVKAVRFLTNQDKPASDKEYRVVRFPTPLDAVDHSKTVIGPSETRSYVQVTKHLALDAGLVGDLDLFRIINMTLGASLFCSERFRSKALEAGAKLLFIPEAEAAEEYARTLNPLTPR